MELRILIWLFPILMAILEFSLRASVRGEDPWEFIGPTIGGAALGMLLPYTREKISAESVKADKQKIRNRHWAESINLLLWIGLTAWATSLYLAVNHGSPYFPEIDGVRTSILIGLILWICAVFVDLLRGSKQ